MSDRDDQQALQLWIRTACLMEVTAPKPGNVHPQAAFDDVTYDDFVRSADVVAPILARAGELGVGWVMLEAVRETKRMVGTNTNLGIVVLLAPLAAVRAGRALARGISDVLDGMTIDDARHCFAAIRLATPGGLGTVEQEDVAAEPSLNLVSVMALAAQRDRVAAQYANGFQDVLERGLPQLARVYEPSQWKTSVVRLQLELMASAPDTLIARKCGWDVARESQHRALNVLQSGWPGSSAGAARLDDFDDWLRADGHQRNPGTTADLVTATLFSGLREGIIPVPSELAQ